MESPDGECPIFWPSSLVQRRFPAIETLAATLVKWISGVAPLVSAIAVDKLCNNPPERALKALLILRSGIGGHTVDQRCQWARIVKATYRRRLS